MCNTLIKVAILNLGHSKYQSTSVVGNDVYSNNLIKGHEAPLFLLCVHMHKRVMHSVMFVCVCVCVCVCV